MEIRQLKWETRKPVVLGRFSIQAIKLSWIWSVPTSGLQLAIQLWRQTMKAYHIMRSELQNWSSPFPSVKSMQHYTSVASTSPFCPCNVQPKCYLSFTKHDLWQLLRGWETSALGKVWQTPSPKNLSIQKPYTHTCIYIYLCRHEHICKRSIWIRTQYACLEVYKLHKMCSSPSRWHSYHKLPMQEPYGDSKQALLYRRHHPPER